MSEGSVAKSSKLVFLLRVLIPVFLLLGAAALVYYYGFYNQAEEKGLEKEPQTTSSSLLPDMTVDVSSVKPSELGVPLSQMVIESPLLDQELLKEAKEVLSNKDETSALPSNKKDGSSLSEGEEKKKEAEDQDFLSEPMPSQEIPDAASLVLPEKIIQGERSPKAYMILSDFIVRARTGLPFESVLLRLQEYVKDRGMRRKLRQLLPYSVEGLGSYPVLVNDLSRIVDKGIHTRAKASDPSLVKFVKNFLHVRKKSPLSPLLKEALDRRDWPKAFALTEKLIEDGFPLKRWLERLKRYVHGHTLLNSFFVSFEERAIQLM